MPDVFLDPRLPDYLVEHDWKQVAANVESSRKVVSDFLSEKICTLHGYDLSALDFEFLSTVTLPQTWQMKKFKFKQLISEAENTKGNHDLYEFVLKEGFRDDRERLNRFIDQLRHLRAIADEIAGRLLADVKVENTIYISRFSETRLENMHFDIDVDSDNHDSFRLYINLDRAPRNWETSYQLTELLKRGGSRLVGDFDDAWPSERILERTTTRAFGGWNQRATERKAPRHVLFFDPGDIWLVDGRCVSHQVVTGHRVLSIYGRMAHEDNPGLGPTFAQKLRTALAEGRRVPIGSETAEVGYYSKEQITSPGSLKDNWADVYGRTGTGRVRKYTDAGMQA
jgi:hypothetical protein